MNRKEFVKKVIEIFGDYTGCYTQNNNSPCNTCFHDIEGKDFRHICWLIILGLRDDYLKDNEENLKLIREELKGE